MSESIPPALQPPVAVALAKLVKTFPPPDALPGVIYAEPKWDGYRTIALIDFDGVTLWSRQGKELTRYSVGVKRQRVDFGLVKVPLSVRDRCRSPEHDDFIPDHHDGFAPR